MVFRLFILFTLCLIQILNKELFDSSQYITQESDINKLLQLLSHKELSLILIYSPHCPHCRNFAPHFVKLADTFHDRAHFYAVNGVESSSYRNKFKIRGYPSLWFYDGDSYKELPSNYEFDYISNYIKTNYLNEFCSEISYEDPHKDITTFITDSNNKIDEEIIGFFQKDDKGAISMFKMAVQLSNRNLPKCFICSDFKKDNKKENTDYLNRRVYILSNQKGLNTFDSLKHYELLDDNSAYFYKQELKAFIRNNIHFYINIDNKDYPFKDLNAQNTLIFSYSTEEEKEKYKNYIYYFSNLNKNQNLDLDYILYDFNCENSKIKYKKFGKNSGIFLSEKDMYNVSSITDIKKIEEMIFKSSQISSKFVSQIKEDEKEIESINKEFNKMYNENVVEEEPFLNGTKLLIAFIFLVIYTLLFYFIFSCVYKKKYLTIINKLKIENQTLSEVEIKKGEYIKAKTEESSESSD